MASSSKKFAMEGRTNYSGYNPAESNDYYAQHSTYSYDSYTGACVKEHSANQNVFTEFLYKEGFWCCATPCTCGGIGVANPLKRPWGLWQVKCCCIENLMSSTPVWNYLGVVNLLLKFGCLMGHFACPPRGGSKFNIPAIACCDYRSPGPDICSCLGCGGEVPEDTEVIGKTFLLFYCWCFGFGLVEPRNAMFRTLVKCCCCQEHCITADPCPADRDCCFNNFKCCCCLAANTYPSLGGQPDGIPACALCDCVICGPPLPYDWWENKAIAGQQPVQYLATVGAPNCWPYRPGGAMISNPSAAC